MKKWAKKAFVTVIELFFLAVLIFLLAGQAEKLIKDFIRSEIQKIFQGEVTVGGLDLGWESIRIRDVKVEDVCTPYPCTFVFIREISLPVPYYWFSDRTIPIANIRVKGLKVKLELQDDNEWNFAKNLRASSGKESTATGVPVNTVFLEDSFFYIDIPLAGERVAFSLQQVFADFMLTGNRMIFKIEGKEDNIGPCSSKGEFHLVQKDFKALNRFKKIPLENQYNQRFIRLLLPFFNHYDFKGKLSLSIPVAYAEKKWKSPIYRLVFKEALFKDKVNLVALDALSGRVVIEENRMKISDATGNMRIQKLFLPFRHLFTESAWIPQGMDFKKIRASVFQGTMEGHMEFLYDRSYSAEMHFKGCSLEDIVSIYKISDQPLKGVAFLDANLLSEKEKGWEIQADGGFYIRKGKFYKYPLFLQIFNFLDFEFPGEEKEKKADIIWSYRSGDLFLKDIQISSGTVDFYGDGVIQKDKTMDMTFTTELGRSKVLSVPLVGDITRDVSNEVMKQLITVKVSGTLEEPRLKKESLERIPKKALGYFIDILKAVSSPITGNGKKEGEK